MRVLLIGSSGMLGTDIRNEWTTDEIIPATSKDADIRDLVQVRALLARTKPDWVVLSAAYTDVDGSEKNQETAFAVNGTGTENVAQAATEAKAKLFYVSTDYVFDGTSSRPYETTDKINPVNVYGASKAAGEKAIQDNARDWIIGRTSWLFGASGSSFPEKILQAAATRPELKVVADQIGSPTFTRDLAAAIRDLIKKDARGMMHITNSGSCSWCDFAKEILRQAGRGIPVHPITTAEAARLAKRPANSILSPASLNAEGIHLRNWQDAVGAYLAEMKSIGKLSS